MTDTLSSQIIIQAVTQGFDQIDQTLRQSLSQAVASSQATVQMLGQQSQQLSQFINQISQSAGAAASSFQKLGTTGQVALGAMIAQAAQSGSSFLMGLATSAYQATAAFETLTMSIQTMVAKELVMTGEFKDVASALGAATTKSEELLGWIQKLAIESPFNTAGVAQAFRMSLAYGATADEAKRMTGALIDFTSASGRGIDVMQRISMSLGQMRAAGKLTGMEMRELSMAGMNLNQVLMEQFKKTSAEVNKALASGAMTMNQVFNAIIAQMEKDYGGAAKRQASSLAGLVSSLQDLKEITLRNFLGPAIKAVQPMLVNLVNTLQDPKVIESLRQWGTAIGSIAASVLSVVDAFLKLPPSFQVAIAGAGALLKVSSDFADNKGLGLFLKTIMKEGSETAGLFPKLIAGIKGFGKEVMAFIATPAGALMAAMAALAATMSAAKTYQDQVSEAMTSTQQVMVTHALEVRKTSKTYEQYATEVTRVNKMVQTQAQSERGLASLYLSKLQLIPVITKEQFEEERQQLALNAAIAAGTDAVSLYVKSLSDMDAVDLKSKFQAGASTLVKVLGDVLSGQTSSIRDIGNVFGWELAKATSANFAIKLKADKAAFNAALLEGAGQLVSNTESSRQLVAQKQKVEELNMLIARSSDDVALGYMKERDATLDAIAATEKAIKANLGKMAVDALIKSATDKDAPMALDVFAERLQLVGDAFDIISPAAVTATVATVNFVNLVTDAKTPITQLRAAVMDIAASYTQTGAAAAAAAREETQAAEFVLQALRARQAAQQQLNKIMADAQNRYIKIEEQFAEAELTAATDNRERRLDIERQFQARMAEIARQSIGAEDEAIRTRDAVALAKVRSARADQEHQAVTSRDTALDAEDRNSAKANTQRQQQRQQQLLALKESMKEQQQQIMQALAKQLQLVADKQKQLEIEAEVHNDRIRNTVVAGQVKVEQDGRSHWERIYDQDQSMFGQRERSLQQHITRISDQIASAVAPQSRLMQAIDDHIDRKLAQVFFQ